MIKFFVLIFVGVIVYDFVVKGNGVKAAGNLLGDSIYFVQTLLGK